MPRHEMESGSIEYGNRAFRQDASAAMHGDIVRGLIELMTNADDAYASMGSCRVGSPGRVNVEVEHRRNQAWQVVVRDRASGMRRQVMKDRLTFLGGRTSGFESGQDRRGNLGRGAKDLAAFGDTTFTSVCDGFISTLVLHPNGTYLISKRESHVTKEERQELGIRHNGTVVTVEVQAGVSCPQHASLKRKLSTHFQLRDILSDPTRRVELFKIGTMEDGDPLVYAYPKLPVVFEGDLDVPGYQEASAHLVIWRHPARCEEGPDMPGRPTGILVKGRRAIYENTLFAFEGNINAAWFSGKLDCPYIDELAQQFDTAEESRLDPAPANPMPIISRQRDGLEKEHPFAKALRTAAEEPLARLVKEEADRVRAASDQAENASTRAALSRLSRELGRLIDDEMKEIDAEEPPGDTQGEPPLLCILPEQGYAYIGEDRTLAVHARADGLSVGDKMTVEVEPLGVVELLTREVELRPHPKREDVLAGLLRFRPLLDDEAVLITGEVFGRSASAYVEVRESRIDEEQEVEQPETLEFEKSSYSVGWQRSKEIRIVAPAIVVAEHGEDVRVESSLPDGVVVRGAPPRFLYDDELDYYVAKLRVEARELHAKSLLTARIGPLVAKTRVNVTRKEAGPSYEIRLVPTSFGISRAFHEEEETASGGHLQVIKIAARHPAIRPYLGDNYEGQNSYACRTIIAEIVADIAARIVVNKLFAMRHSTEDFDAPILYREHYRRLERFLPKFQRILIGDPKRAQEAELADATAMPVSVAPAETASETPRATLEAEPPPAPELQLPLS